MGFIHTSADATSSSSSKAGPKVTLQSFSVVTRLGQAAVLIQLPGANFAATAAVQDDAHAGCTLGHLRQTLTHGGAIGGGEDLYSHQQNLLLNAGTSEVFRQTASQNFIFNHVNRMIDLFSPSFNKQCNQRNVYILDVMSEIQKNLPS